MLIRKHAIHVTFEYNNTVQQPVPDNEMEHSEDNEILPYFCKAREFSAHWKVLGVFLKVPISRLEAIKRENHAVDDCMLAMLHAWMNQDDQHSEEKLEFALKEVYSHPEIQGYHASAESMTISSATQTEIMGYQKEFRDLMWDTVRALKERFPDPEELALKVNEILKEPKSMHIMFETPPTSHFAIISRLQKEWSYTNPKLLRLLIQQTISKSAESKRPITRLAASNTLEKRMESYCQRYRSFCKSLQITTESCIVFEGLDPSKPCLNLTIQEGPLALEDIYIFLEEEFAIYNRYFRIHRIDPGSIKIILQFPASMTELIETCIKHKRQTAKWFAKKSLESQKHHIDDKLICTMNIEPPQKRTEDKQLTTTKKSSSGSQDTPNPPKKRSSDSQDMQNPPKKRKSDSQVMLNPPKKRRSDSQGMLNPQKKRQSRRLAKLHKGHGKHIIKLNAVKKAHMGTIQTISKAKLCEGHPPTINHKKFDDLLVK